MNILDKDPLLERGDLAVRVAKELKMETYRTFELMSRSFNRSVEIFWKNAEGLSPQQIADELGTDAAEMFNLHFKLGQLLAEIKPDSISYGLSAIGNTIVNQDGTVTVTDG